MSVRQLKLAEAEGRQADTASMEMKSKQRHYFRYLGAPKCVALSIFFRVVQVKQLPTTRGQGHRWFDVVEQSLACRVTKAQLVLVVGVTTFLKSSTLVFGGGSNFVRDQWREGARGEAGQPEAQILGALPYPLSVGFPRCSVTMRRWKLIGSAPPKLTATT